MRAETVNLQGHNGDLLETYFARPLGAGPYPGVVVIHHMPGWDEESKETTRKLAYHGYVAICPNLHYREAPGVSSDDAAAAVRTAGGVPDDRCIGDMEAAASYLRTLPYSNGKLGLIGYCSGGRQSLLVACNSSSFDAAVDCYGGRVVVQPEQLTPAAPVPVIDMIGRLDTPLLGLFGNDDGNPNPAQVAIIEEKLKSLHKTYEFHSYEGAGHAFFSVDRPSYNQPAAVDGWQRVFAWFEKYLTA